MPILTKTDRLELIEVKGFEAFSRAMAELQPVAGSQEAWLKYGHDRFVVADSFAPTGPCWETHKEDEKDTLSRVRDDEHPNLFQFLTEKSKTEPGGVFLVYALPQGFPLGKCVEISNNVGAEIDHGTPDEQLQNISNLVNISGLKPAKIVTSGGKSYHSHWYLKDHIPVDQTVYLRRLVCIALMADPAACNPHQPMRIEGFERWEEVRKEDEKVLVFKGHQTRVYESPERYGYDEMIEGLKTYFDAVNLTFPAVICDNWWRQLRRTIKAHNFTDLQAELEKGYQPKPKAQPKKIEYQPCSDFMGRQISDYVEEAKRRLDTSLFEAHGYIEADRRFCCPFHDSTSGNSAWSNRANDGMPLFYCPTCTNDDPINSFDFWRWLKFGKNTPIPKDKAYVEQAKEFCQLANITIPEFKPERSNMETKTSNKKESFELEADKFKLELQSLAQENDLIKRTLKLSNLAAQKRISVKQLELLISTVSTNASRPKAVRHKIGEFIQLESGNSSTQLIPGLIGKGVNLIAGEAGAGKTTMAYDLAGSVVTGEPFLGETPTQTGNVLIVSSDEGRSYAQDKLINRGLGGYSDEIEILEFWDVSQMQLLEDIISETRPTLVIVDSFNAIHSDPNFDENSAQSSQTIKFLERLASIYNTTVVLTHHLNKCKDQKGLGRLRGSTAIAASVSVALILENADKGELADTRKRLYSPKMRGGEPIDLLLDMNPHEGRFSLVNPSPGEETKPLCDQLMPFFTRNAGTLFEVKELETLGFTAKNNKYFYTALDRMVKRGQIVKRPSKINPRSKVYGISCTDQNDSHHPPQDTPPYSSLLSEEPTAETLNIKDFEVSHHPSHHPVITQSSGQNMVQAETLIQQENADSHHPGQAGGGGSKNCTEDSGTVLNAKKVEEGLTWDAIMTDIKCCLALLGWDKERARDEIAKYLGLSAPIKSIARLNDHQLISALQYLTDLACQAKTS